MEIKDKIERINVSELKFYPDNPRTHSKDQIEKLCIQIKQVGFNQPIIIDELNQVLVGNGRLKAAQELKMKELPCIKYSELTQLQKKQLIIADNKLNDLSDWDVNIVGEWLNELVEGDMESFFEPKEMTEIWDEQAKEDKFDTEKAVKHPKYKAIHGDVFLLGKHRLMCGDSTNQEMMIRLMNGNKARMVFTDPPYGVSYKGTNNPNGKAWEVIEGDDLRGDGLYDLLYPAFTNIHKHLIENPALYVFYASVNHILFEKALVESGYLIKQQIIWDKHHVLGHSDYHWNHEPMLYCRKKEKNSEWFGDRKQKTILERTEAETEKMTKEQLIEEINRIKEGGSVWHIKKDAAQTYVHPTQKPIGLAFKGITNSSIMNEIVLEPFAGSGSTLLACEQTKRRCYAMEFDPQYASAIIERWETMTGLKATKEDLSPIELNPDNIEHE